MKYHIVLQNDNIDSIFVYGYCETRFTYYCLKDTQQGLTTT